METDMDKLIQLKDTDGNNMFPRIVGRSIPDKAVCEEHLSDALKALVMEGVDEPIPDAGDIAKAILGGGTVGGTAADGGALSDSDIQGVIDEVENGETNV